MEENEESRRLLLASLALEQWLRFNWMEVCPTEGGECWRLLPPPSAREQLAGGERRLLPLFDALCGTPVDAVQEGALIMGFLARSLPGGRLSPEDEDFQQHAALFQARAHELTSRLIEAEKNGQPEPRATDFRLWLDLIGEDGEAEVGPGAEPGAAS